MLRREFVRQVAGHYAAATTGLQDALRISIADRPQLPHPGAAVFGKIDPCADYAHLPAYWSWQVRDLSDAEIRELLGVFEC